MRIRPRVNGEVVALEIEPQELLLDCLRETLGLTSAKRSCDVQVCGACTVLLDGLPVSSCCTLAYEADGRDVVTVEGLAGTAEFAGIEAALVRHAAVQCGFCTPGMALTIKALLEDGEGDLRAALSGNLCRCTGYKAILEAVEELAGA